MSCVQVPSHAFTRVDAITEIAVNVLMKLPSRVFTRVHALTEVAVNLLVQLPSHVLNTCIKLL